MTRDEVIRGLQEAIQNFERYSGDEYGREYDYARVEVDVLENVLAMLKAQEPRVIKNSAGNGICPVCGHIIPAWSSPNYCGYCGQAVMWK